MIQLYENPTLLDYIKVCWQLPQDERDQLEAFTGHSYGIDGAAMGAATTVGPKWVARNEADEPVCIAGLVLQRPGVYLDFMLNTPEAFEKHWFAITRATRKVLNYMLDSRQAHRIECICLASREAKNSRWYKAIGYNREATLYGYAANGADAVIYSRVKR